MDSGDDQSWEDEDSSSYEERIDSSRRFSSDRTDYSSRRSSLGHSNSRRSSSSSSWTNQYSSSNGSLDSSQIGSESSSSFYNDSNTSRSYYDHSSDYDSTRRPSRFDSRLLRFARIRSIARRYTIWAVAFVSTICLVGVVYQQNSANRNDAKHNQSNSYGLSLKPTSIPTVLISSRPSLKPSPPPSFEPSIWPTNSMAPSKAPTEGPSSIPSIGPSDPPTKVPSYKPSFDPSKLPSMAPTLKPSDLPSLVPTLKPSAIPTNAPSHIPSIQSSDEPSSDPSTAPSEFPTSEPSHKPSVGPTIEPSELPSWIPSVKPSSNPTDVRTESPSSSPSVDPFVILITEVGDPFGDPYWYPFIELYSPNRRNHEIQEDITLIRWSKLAVITSPDTTQYVNLKGKRINSNGFLVFCINAFQWGDSCDYSVGYSSILQKGSNYHFALVAGLDSTSYTSTIDIYGRPGAWDDVQDYENGRAVRKLTADTPSSTWREDDWFVVPAGECYAPVLTQSCDPGAWNTTTIPSSAC